MIRRARFVASIITLTALTLSFAESLWAATCAPAMPMGSMSEMAPPDSDAADCPAGGQGMHAGRALRA
jgi:hypothetical protein